MTAKLHLDDQLFVFWQKEGDALANATEEKRIGLADAEKIWKLLDSNPYELSTVVIHLAWRCGLSTGTIWTLKWQEIDFEKAFLRLSDRDVPIEQKTLRQLRIWKNVCDGYGCEHITVSLKTKKYIVIQSLSRIVRDALSGIGLASINIKDLRNDFIERALKQYDWEYAMKICGLTTSTYKTEYVRMGSHERPIGPRVNEETSDMECLRQVLKKNKGSTAGLALWLVFDADLRIGETASLQWDQVDFAKRTVSTERGETILSEQLTEMLEKEKASRLPDEPAYVILSPKSRKPMDFARTSVTIKNLLMKSGLSTTDVKALKSAIAQEPLKHAVMDFVRKNGSVNGAKASEILGTTKASALSILKALSDEGKLAKTRKDGWHLSEEVVSVENWRNAVIELARKQGCVTRGEVAEMLHTGNYSARSLLRNMRQEGTLKQIHGKGAYELSDKRLNEDEK